MSAAKGGQVVVVAQFFFVHGDRNCLVCRSLDSGLLTVSAGMCGAG